MAYKILGSNKAALTKKHGAVALGVQGVQLFILTTKYPPSAVPGYMPLLVPEYSP